MDDDRLPTIERHMFKGFNNNPECGWVEAGPGRACREPKDHAVHTPTGTTRESWLYDKAKAQSHITRDAVRAIVTTRDPDDPVRAVLVEALHDLVDEQARWRDAWAHATVNGDHRLREAMARAESCEHHGAEIKALSEQVAHFDEVYRRADAGRVALLGLLHGIDRSLEIYDRKLAAGEPVPDSPALFEALRRMVADTRREHDKAWKRAQA